MKTSYIKPEISQVKIDCGNLLVAVSAGGGSVDITPGGGEGDGSDAAAKDFKWGNAWEEE